MGMFAGCGIVVGGWVGEGEGNKKGYENKTICRTSSDSRQILGVTFDGCRLWSQ